MADAELPDTPVPADEAEDEKSPSLIDIRITARREKVKRLFARRMTTAEIATTLQVSERTIAYDLKEIRHELAAEITRTDAVGMAATILQRSEARQRELWGMFGALKGTGTDVVQTKLQILRDLRAETKDELDTLQKLGIVQRAPVEVLMHLRAIAALNQVPPAQVEAMAALPAQEFMARLAEVCGEDAVASWMPDLMLPPIVGAALGDDHS